MQLDIRVTELLASKICHDLVSPVSAINNGVELIEDIGGSVVDEAMKLIGDSGQTASRRLRMFRMAYGRAGSDDNMVLKDVRQVAQQYVSGDKVTLEWPDTAETSGVSERRGFYKTLLNLVILAEELLPYGGVIAIKPDLETCVVEIVGRNAQLNPAIKDALEGSVAIEDITPRSIQAYVAGRMGDHFGFKLGHDQSMPDRLDLRLTFPEESARLVSVS